MNLRLLLGSSGLGSSRRSTLLREAELALDLSEADLGGISIAVSGLGRDNIPVDLEQAYVNTEHKFILVGDIEEDIAPGRHLEKVSGGENGTKCEW
jgi:hypothetical protein